VSLEYYLFTTSFFNIWKVSYVVLYQLLAEIYQTIYLISQTDVVKSKQKHGFTNAIKCMCFRCLSVCLDPWGSPASEEASWLWCSVCPLTSRNTLPVWGNAVQTIYRTEQKLINMCNLKQMQTGRFLHFSASLTQIWKGKQPLEKRPHLPRRKMALPGESPSPAWEIEKRKVPQVWIRGFMLSRFLFVPFVHAPSAGNPPRVWAQLPGLLRFSSEPSRASHLQGQTSHSRWLHLEQSVPMLFCTAGWLSIWR